MTPARWREITDVFHAALAHDVTERDGFVADACRDDPDLRLEVEALLAAHENAGSFGGGGLTGAPQIALASGTTLGPYRIEALIGAGGMGEVYRATDTRLGRTVAIKILPTHLRGSADRRARFDREARTISQLTHPHICTLHDVGHENGTDFLVMEYLEGETLAARLTRGAIPLEEAVQIGVQAAGALAHAHRHGIVHRDLKPANIILTPTGVKLLDFGLAKLRSAPALTDDPAPTAIKSGVTAAGTLVGTLHYMAPELLDGREADERSDIWALGCVLYELAAGRKAFDGESPASLIAAIHECPPAPLRQSGRTTPGALEHLIAVCLAKQADARWQSAADVAMRLDGIGRAAHRRTPAIGPRFVPATLFATAAVLLVGAAAYLWWRDTSRPVARAPAPAALRASVNLAGSGLTVDPGGLAISPDGETLVFAATGRDGQRLYQRPLRDTDPTPLPGTERAMVPFFSPDGDWVAYFVQGRGLFKIPLSGGQPQLVCEAGGGDSGTWGADGRIIFSTVVGKEGTGLWEVSAEGGAAKRLLPSGRGEAVSFLRPELLPSGKTVLYTERQGGRATVAALDFATGKVQKVLDGSQARYVSSGHLLYLFSNHLYAVEFDTDQLKARGPARVVLENLGDERVGNGLFAVSRTGTLAYVGGALGELVWIDRAGVRTRMKLDPRPYLYPALSRDGQLLAVTVNEGSVRNVWIGKTAGGPLTKLTSGNDDVFSLFTPDAKRVVYTAGDNGRYNLFSIAVDGSEPPTQITGTSHAQKATSFSGNGRIMLLNDIDGGNRTGLDILQMDIGRPDAIHAFRKTPAIEVGGTFSPDGHWVAYLANDTGRLEAYVEAFPGPGVRSQVSSGGAQIPAWNPRSGELLYQGPTAIMSVPFRDGQVGAATKVLDRPHSAGFLPDWIISSDGRRFLVIERSASTSPSEIKIALNWLDELKSRVPIAK